MEGLKARILEIVEDYEEGISVLDNDMAQAGIDPKSDFVNTIEQLLEERECRAREEGRREYFSMGMEYFSLIEDSNIYQQKGWKLPEEKAKRLQILEKIFNLILKTKEDGK